MKKVLWVVLVVGCLSLTAVRPLWAGEVDVLVEKLVEKGILSSVEAQIILDETKSEVAKQNAQAKNGSLPRWIQTMKMKGDFRLRYQYERRHDDSEGRTRGRYRLRLGVSSKVTDQVKVGFGLATGGTDPKSTNQSFAGNNSSGESTAFSTPDIRLDYAYGEYQPTSNYKLAAGKFKMKDYLWHATDLLWDSDINPEGMSMHWEDGLVDGIDYWANGGVWVLEHNDQVDKPDPFLTYVQAGVKAQGEVFGKDVDSKVATTFYNFQGLKGNDLADSEGGNTTDGAGLLLSSYNSLAVSSEVGVRKLLGGLPFNVDDRIAVFADFIRNFDDELVQDYKTTGWAFGVKFGHKKVKNAGSWQIKYINATLGADSWPDAFPDSDRGFGGETDIHSHEVALKYALKKNIILGLDYYQSRHYARSGSDDTEHLIQADCSLKF